MLYKKINKLVKFSASIQLQNRYLHELINKKLNLSYTSSPSHHPLICETIGQRLDFAAERFEKRESFVFSQTGERLTFLELKKRAEDLATGLLAIGINRGDRVGLWAPNCMEWILTQYATALIGAIQVNINPAYKSSELEYSLNKVGCKAIIMSETYKKQNFVQILNTVCPELDSSKPGQINSKRVPHLKSAILIGKKNHSGYFLFDQVSNSGDSSHYEKYNQIKRKLSPSDPINIQYTSGTTGFPKGVTLTHHMILNNAFQTSTAFEYQKNRSIICLQVPLYHCLGMVCGSLSTLTHGTTCIMPDFTYNPESSLKAIQQEKCTHIYGTPTMYIDMYNHPNFVKYDVSSLRGGFMTGSTCPIEIVQETIKKLNVKDIVIGYGLTETSPVITISSIHDSLENRTQTIGKVMGHLEVKIVDKDGHIVALNETGELLIRGYSTMIGYWNDPEKTQEAFTHDRFFKTGDIVTMNSHGYIRHQGRMKDMVIRGGENIYPREIEEFLHKHPKIQDVYVIGVPDKRFGEELCACIKLNANEKMSVEDVKEYCKGQIAHFKIPRYVEFTNEFPLTVSGKIQKNKLKEKMTKKLNL